MRDVQLQEIIDQVASEMEIPARVMRKMTMRMFLYIHKVMATRRDRIVMYRSPMNQVYTEYDATKMCEEYIEGTRDGFEMISKTAKQRAKFRYQLNYFKKKRYHHVDPHIRKMLSRL